MTAVSVMGGSGYVGGELLRLLVSHPACELQIITSRQHAGDPLFRVHPNLRGVTNADGSRVHDCRKILDDSLFLHLLDSHKDCCFTDACFLGYRLEGDAGVSLEFAENLAVGVVEVGHLTNLHESITFPLL